MDERLTVISAKGDDLNAIVDFETFQSNLAQACRARTGRKQLLSRPDRTHIPAEQTALLSHIRGRTIGDGIVAAIRKQAGLEER